MKAEHTIDKPARAGRATQIAAMVITGLVAFIWVYFGRLCLIHDPDEWRIANQQLGYVPSNRESNGKFRRVRVRVEPAGRQFKVSHRLGYYAPMQ